jgi:TonB family protein
MRVIHGWGLAVFVAGCVALGQAQAEEKKADAATQASGSGPRSETPGVYRPEDGVVIPKVIDAPQPDFSDKARSKKLGGICVLSMLVDAQGKPHDVQVVKSIAEGVKPKLRSAALGLDENAVKAVQPYRFQPTTMQGRPVPYRMKIEVESRID